MPIKKEQEETILLKGLDNRHKTVTKQCFLWPFSAKNKGKIVDTVTNKIVKILSTSET